MIESNQYHISDYYKFKQFKIIIRMTLKTNCKKRTKYWFKLRETKEHR